MANKLWVCAIDYTDKNGKRLRWKSVTATQLGGKLVIAAAERAIESKGGTVHANDCTLEGAF